jgi:hypothetical protein
MSDLRAVVVIDYQNVHLTGHGLFACSRYAPVSRKTGTEGCGQGTVRAGYGHDGGHLPSTVVAQ